MPTQEMPMQYVNRKEWGANAPLAPLLPLQHPVPFVRFTFTTRVKSCHSERKCTKRVKEIQRIDTEERGLPDMAPNFLVGGDGYVYEGRGWRAQPEKIPNRPDLDGKFVEICFIGDYSKRPPSNEMIRRSVVAMEIGTGHNLLDKYYDILDLGGVRYLDLGKDEPSSM
ncbi:peptidoglycan-recognition protein 1-like [Macrosteles quadrilineatus]|uniref:peptidoglycan-recognition protein 1-like n=1 Tax=Macrosteles quadrilineatus TaxID=74068 RepID=UPI0023E10E3D|nr:peptidoglycan-recognition protein 1-like [Macrosteles quadrilineatus]